MLDELMIKVNEILENCSEEETEKYSLIKSIISTEEWYKQIGVDTVISILVDLGYTVEEAKKIYMQLKGIEV